MEPDVKACTHCGSTDLQWHPDIRAPSGVQDGRLCHRELSVSFYLGCNYCSETLGHMTGDKVAEILTTHYKENTNE